MKSLSNPVDRTYVEVYRNEINDIATKGSPVVAKRAEENIQDIERNRDLIRRAQRMYEKYEGDHIIEISDEALITKRIMDDGYSVMAWVYVPATEQEEC